MSAHDPPEKDRSDRKAPPAYRQLRPRDSRPGAPQGKPQPEAAQPAKPAASSVPAKPAASPEASHADPTRFGDWEIKGRCIDF